MDFKEFSKRANEIRAKYSILEKREFGQEWTSLNLAEGFVGDVGDLMKLIMAKEGLRKIEGVDEKLAVELADCLWSVLVISEKYGINLEKAFFETMNEIEKQIEVG